jgi:hypothetical protein
MLSGIGFNECVVRMGHVMVSMGGMKQGGEEGMGWEGREGYGDDIPA